MPAQRATLNFSNADPAAMEVASDDPTRLTGQILVKESGTYKIDFRTTGGQINPNPVNYDIVALKDREPTIRFVRPDRPSIKVPANVKVDLEMAGSDDHGFRDATLHVMLGTENLVSKNVLEGQPQRNEFRAVETLDLPQFRVKPGSVISYWLTAKDNKEPSPNRKETARQVIEVIAPVSPEEKKTLEEKAKKEREQNVPPPQTN
jgi:hypothetical protein